MATPRELITAAYGFSTKNQPQEIATEETELLEVVQRALHRAYAIGARANPMFFGKTTAVPASTATWARPADAELVFRIEMPDTTEVVVVPMDDRDTEPEQPALYRFGQVYYPSGNASDPSTETLTFFYSQVSPTVADIDSTIDASWPVQFNNLLIFEIALYLAHKDGREEELPRLQSGYNEWLNLFLGFLQHETANERRRWGHMPMFNHEAITAITDTMPGG